MLRRLSDFAAAIVLALVVSIPAQAAQAAMPVYMKNHIRSTVNMSMSTTNPPSSGHIYAIKPGYAGTGLCFYAPAGRATVYWYDPNGGIAKVATAGAWKCPAYSNEQITVRIT